MTTTARHSGSRCRSASSRRSRSTIAVAMSARGRAVRSGSSRPRRPVLAATNEVEAGMDDEPAEPGVEPVRIAKPGRSRQARMNPSWTASRASSGSRRISRAAASSRATAAPASSRRRHDRPASLVRRGLAGPRQPQVSRGRFGRARWYGVGRCAGIVPGRGIDGQVAAPTAPSDRRRHLRLCRVLCRRYSKMKFSMTGIASATRLSKRAGSRAVDVDHHDVTPAQVQEDKSARALPTIPKGSPAFTGLGEEQRDRLRFTRARRGPGGCHADVHPLPAEARGS